MREWRLVRSRPIAAPPEVVASQWANWDIFDAVLGNRFRVERIDDRRWRLSYAGIKGELKLTAFDWDDRKGDFQYVLHASKSPIPAQLYEVALTYHVADSATIVTGTVTAHFEGWKRLIARFARDEVERVLDEVLKGGDQSSQLLADRSGQARQQLDARQRARLRDFDVEADRLRYNPNRIVLQLTPIGETVGVQLEAPSLDRGALDHTVKNPSPFRTMIANVRDGQRARRGGAALRDATAVSRSKALQYGKQLYSDYLSEPMRHRLTDAVRPPAAARLEICASGSIEGGPWEFLHNENDFVCLRIPVVRRATCTSTLQLDPIADVSALVVGANPDGDLPGVADEVRWAVEALQAANVQITTIEPSDATKARVVQELRKGTMGVFHYAGHSVFDPDDPANSHLRLAGDNLYAHELGRIAAGTRLSLVFLNSCESARNPADEDGAAGLAHTLLRDGVSQVIAMRWSITDEAGSALARAFYADLASGRDVGRALKSARNAAGEIDWDDLTWLAPILYA